jgi:hypothetical protein
MLMETKWKRWRSGNQGIRQWLSGYQEIRIEYGNTNSCLSVFVAILKKQSQSVRKELPDRC